MTNVELLEQKINESGLKIKYIADCLGISRTLLWQKANGQKPFNQYEINGLCRILDIKSASEREAIFFAPDVD